MTVPQPWVKQPMRPPDFPVYSLIRGDEERDRLTASNETAEGAFRLFFNEDLIALVIRETNRYAAMKGVKCRRRPRDV